jgi:hypothetical protein
MSKKELYILFLHWKQLLFQGKAGGRRVLKWVKGKKVLIRARHILGSPLPRVDSFKEFLGIRIGIFFDPEVISLEGL